MLKSLVVLSLLAIASASTTHSLSEIVGFTGAVAVTATYPDAGTPPTLSAITYTTTYDSSLATLLPFTVSAGTAASTGNNTVQGGFLTLTNGGDTVTVPFGAISTGTNTYSLISGNNYLKFLNTGNYAVSVSLTTAILGTYAVTLSAAFPTVAVTKYTPPVLTAVSYLSPQTGGCDASSCTGYLSGNVSATSRPSSYWTTYLRSTHASTGVIFSSSATFNSGTAHLDTDTLAGLVVNVGGLVNGVWKSTLSGTTAETHVPQNDNLVISGQFLEQTGRNTYFNEAAVGAFQSSVKLTSGSTDVTAPTCTVLTTNPPAITTVASSMDVTAILTCADETGGSGLWINGLFITATITNGNAGTQSFPTLVSGSATFSVPPYISGTLNVVGAFAVDNAGNAALYGSCGDAVGYDSLGCAGGGSGSSSASTVAFSLFSILLVVLSLFA